jgi:hypothetical protein
MSNLAVLVAWLGQQRERLCSSFDRPGFLLGRVSGTTFFATARKRPLWSRRSVGDVFVLESITLRQVVCRRRVTTL